MDLKKTKSDHNLLNVQETVTKLAASALQVKASKISADEALFSTKNAFDSFALLELVLYLEEAFHVKIPDEDLDPDIFHSVRTITAYIHGRLRKGD